MTGGPPELTPLELLAVEADIDPWVLRDWLEREIERRRMIDHPRS